MRLGLRLLLVSCLGGFSTLASSQDYVQKTPPSDQTITQPDGTSLIVNNLAVTSAANFATNVGIGTATPDQQLVVAGLNATIEAFNTSNGGEYSYFGTYPTLFQFSYNRVPSTGVIPNPQESSAYINVQGGSGAAGFDVVLQKAPGGEFTNVLHASGNGAVGVGTSTPGVDVASLMASPTTPVLEVDGVLALAQGHGGQVIFSDGTVQSTAWNGTAIGGDYAESVDVIGDRAGYEPGDVIVIDGAANGKFKKSKSAYSRMVAGVYSTKPGLLGRRTTAPRPDEGAEVPMAMTGIVPTKVSAENGPVKRGDLLVSSSKPGYAMKGTDRDRLTGAIIGKALAPLQSGEGTIEVLLTLQ